MSTRHKIVTDDDLRSLSGESRTDELRAWLDEERSLLNSDVSSPLTKSIASANVNKLSAALRSSELNDKARERMAAAEEERSRKEAEVVRKRNEARRKQARDSEYRELRQSFLGNNPGADEEDFERVYPGMRDDLMRQRAITAEERARQATRPKL
jgi:hypothetical protein